MNEPTDTNLDIRVDLIRTPVGPVTLGVRDDGALAWLSFTDDFSTEQREMERHGYAAVLHPGAAPEASRQLDEFFRGERRAFDLKLAPHGTEFQQRVWAELCRIPFGQTISYRQLAQRVGKPAAVRAVGQANGANPIALVIPCHRVIASDGNLGGYTGGLPLKRQLLQHENAIATLF